MFNGKSLEATANARWSDRFVRPLYGSYCFAHIPATIERCLTGESSAQALPADVLGDLPERYERVVLLFVDAFGWRFLERHWETLPALREIVDHGVASKITSMFPSTTAAHVTTIHTGLPVADSGVYEWYYYEPQLDAVISPLLFSYAGTPRETVAQAGVEPGQIFPTPEFYPRLAAAGVRSYLFQDEVYANSSYSRYVSQGAERVPYLSIPHGLDTLREKVATEVAEGDGSAYFCLYIDRFDTRCHSYGPNTKKLDAVAEKIFGEIDEQFLRPLLGNAPNTLLLVTADHGQVEVEPKRFTYIDEEWPDVVPYLETTRAGAVIAPVGSARDFFLHVPEEAIGEVCDLLRERLAGRADVLPTTELLNDSFFGATPSMRLRERMGSVVVLPYAREAVFWSAGGRFEQDFKAHHGGLTPEEMETIFLALPLG